MTAIQPDDWFVPDQKSTVPAAGADDWFVPPEPPTPLRQRISEFITPTPLRRVAEAVVTGAEQGFGNEPLGLSPEHEKELQQAGIFHTPGQDYTEPLQLTNEAIIHTAAKAGDVAMRGLSALGGAVAGGVKQAAVELGENPAQAARLERDVGTMEELGLIAPVPEATFNAHAQPDYATPADIRDFLDRANKEVPAPKPYSKTRAEIDEFLAQRAAREAAQNAGAPRLPGPDDWTVPPESAAATQQGGAQKPAETIGTQGTAPLAPDIDAAYPDLTEPGRTEPASPEETEQPPAQPSAPPLNAGPAKFKQLLEDARSADEIRTAMEAAKAWQPTAEWQRIPEGVDLAQFPGMETRVARGRTFARLVPPVPAAGTPENPIVLAGPQDVHAGAERTEQPTPAQAEAGNFRKRHLTWNGLDLAIETEAGQERTGISPTGQPWSVTLKHPYGYIKRHEGTDGEGIDVYLGPQPQAANLYVVDQVDPATGAFDEHKALIGFPNAGAARAAYEAAFSDGSGSGRLGEMVRLTGAQFKRWLSEGDLSRPLAYTSPVEAARAIAKQTGLHTTEEELAEAARVHKVSNTDLTDALVAVLERNAIAEEADSADSIQAQEGPHGEAVTPTSSGETGAKPAPAVEPAGPPGTPQAGETPPRGKSREAERDRREAGESHPVEPAEPELEHHLALSTASLKKLLKRIPSMDAAARNVARSGIETVLSAMADDGRKIAEHCVATGGRFSLRG